MLKALECQSRLIADHASVREQIVISMDNITKSVNTYQ